MHEVMTVSTGLLADSGLLAGIWSTLKGPLLVFAGFSLVIFIHELGHFIAAKLCNVKVEKFCIGFGRELFGFTRGETRYGFNILPFGGYVKMHGQEDFTVDKSGEWAVKDDPRAFTHKPVWQRMIIVSAGVVMNVVSAALLFMFVFMVGIDFASSEVGMVVPESPAERAGLQRGDRIVEIDGSRITDFNDLVSAVALSDPDEELRVVFERPLGDGPDGRIERMTVSIQPERNDERNMMEIGVGPKHNTTVIGVREDPDLPPDQQVRVGDTILEIDDKAVDSLVGIVTALVRLRGEYADVKVLRTLPDGAKQEVMVKRRARPLLKSTQDFRVQSGHLLGLVPRRRIETVQTGSRADLAGFRLGDVITKWDGRAAPTIDEILTSIRGNPERDIRVEVLRTPYKGTPRRVELVVRPEGPGWIGEMRGATPLVGLHCFYGELHRLVVADIVDELEDGRATPASVLAETMPRGSLITQVNGQTVRTWSELRDAFIALAGQNVELSWKTPDGEQQSGALHVPRSLGIDPDVPADYRLVQIDGKREVVIRHQNRLIPVGVANPQAARQVLSECVGRTIDVEYRDLLTGDALVKQVAVTEDMLDCWGLRLGYEMGSDLITDQVMALVQETNPFKAMWIGVNKTIYFIEQVYIMVQRMVVTRSVGLDQVSGPVGILAIGSQIAERDIVKLVYFLALISANLAVINFLPLPIVDGGLFVFLLVEWIKGKPVSIRVQVATQMIGLALILSIFVYVTFNDILRLAS